MSIASATVTFAGGHNRTEIDWMPEFENYETTVDALADIDIQLKAHGAVHSFLERLSLVADQISGEKNQCGVSRLRSSSNDLEIYECKFDIDVGHDNIDSWVFEFAVSKNALVAKQVNRYFVGPNFHQRGVPLVITDFEISPRGWASLRDALLERIGRPVRQDKVDQVMKDVGFTFRREYRGNAGTKREGMLAREYFFELPMNRSYRSWIKSSISGSVPRVTFFWDFYDGGEFIKVSGTSTG